jgi:bacterial/archaeal transporter family-2 protein
MQQRFNLGVIVAALSGSVFGVVTSIEGFIGRSVGAISASLIEHAVAALIAVPAVVFLFMRGTLTWDNTKSIVPASAVVAVLIIVAVAGVAYSMPIVGVAAGNMAMLFGQMTLAILIDTMGIGGYDKVPLSLPRIAGLILMVVGVYLVLPRQG